LVETVGVNVSTHLIEIYNIDTVIFAIFKAEKIHIVALSVMNYK